MINCLERHFWCFVQEQLGKAMLTILFIRLSFRNHCLSHNRPPSGSPMRHGTKDFSVPAAWYCSYLLYQARVMVIYDILAFENMICVPSKLLKFSHQQPSIPFHFTFLWDSRYREYHCHYLLYCTNL